MVRKQLLMCLNLPISIEIGSYSGLILRISKFSVRLFQPQKSNWGYDFSPCQKWSRKQQLSAFFRLSLKQLYDTYFTAFVLFLFSDFFLRALRVEGALSLVTIVISNGIRRSQGRVKKRRYGTPGVNLQPFLLLLIEVLSR